MAFHMACSQPQLQMGVGEHRACGQRYRACQVGPGVASTTAESTRSLLGCIVPTHFQHVCSQEHTLGAGTLFPSLHCPLSRNQTVCECSPETASHSSAPPPYPVLRMGLSGAQCCSGLSPPTPSVWAPGNQSSAGRRGPVGCSSGCSSQVSSCPTDAAGAQPHGLLPAPLPMVGPPLRDPQQPLPGARGALLHLPRTADVHPPWRLTDPLPGESLQTPGNLSVACQFPRKTLLGFSISVSCLLFVFVECNLHAVIGVPSGLLVVLLSFPLLSGARAVRGCRFNAAGAAPLIPRRGSLA